jgi:site-specific DNA-methyltransferase (adenine-specific)
MSNNIFFKRGQMADKPNNYLWLGDCLDLMKDIPDKSIDAIICDLPYGTTACKWDIIIPFDSLWKQYKRIVKDNGAIVLFGSEPFSSHLRLSNLKNYKYDWIWEKNIPTNFFMAKKMPMRIYEKISVFYRNQPTFNPIKEKRTQKSIDRLKYKHIVNNKTEGTVYGVIERKYESKDKNYRMPTDVIKINMERRNTGEAGLHPTQKPLELLKYLVKTYTNENDWVLDNTCGSNTTGIACYNLNRNYIGIEKDIDIYKVAKERVEKNILLRANEQQTLFNDKH